MARVAFGAVDQMRERVVVDREVLIAEAAVFVGERPLEQDAQFVGPELLEPEQRGARQQRAGEREERILGGRADEHEQALFDVRQQRVLLRAVEAVHLVEEQDRAPAVLAHAGPGPLGDLADVLHARGDRRQGLERLLGGARHQTGDGGLAGAGRTPQHHRREAIGLDEHPQRTARPEQLLLADDFVERPRPQAGGKGRTAFQPLQDRRGEEVIGHTQGYGCGEISGPLST